MIQHLKHTQSFHMMKICFLFQIFLSFFLWKFNESIYASVVLVLFFLFFRIHNLSLNILCAYFSSSWIFIYFIYIFDSPPRFSNHPLYRDIRKIVKREINIFFVCCCPIFHVFFNLLYDFISLQTNKLKTFINKYRKNSLVF